MGASGEPPTIALPAGRFGRPELLLDELWSKKGVAAAIVNAVDRKSAILAALLAWPVGAAVGINLSVGRAWLSVPVAIILCTAAGLVPAWRALRATGWSAAALTRLITYEALGIGGTGAVVGAGAGLGIASVLVDGVTDALWWTASLTMAVGLLVTVIAAVVPAALQRQVPMSVLLAEE